MKKNKEVKVAWIDTETTGTDAVKNGLIQVAMLIEINGEVVDEHQWNIQPFPTDVIEQEALEVNGVTHADLDGFTKPEQAHDEIEEFLAQYVDRYDRGDKLIPAGQNVRFDIDFLARFWEACQDRYFGSFFTWIPLDLMYVARLFAYKCGEEPENYKLETLAQWFHVYIPENLHDSLVDIQLTRSVMRKMLEFITVHPRKETHGTRQVTV